MKISQRELKTSVNAYLYSDGHMVLRHRKRDKDAGEITWVTIYQNVGIKAMFKGRLVIDKGALPFVLHSSRVDAREPSFDRGSENTKKLGLNVGSVSLYNGSDYGFHINLFDTLISSDFTYQPNTNEKFDDVKDLYSWGYEPLKKVYTEL